MYSFKHPDPPELAARERASAEKFRDLRNRLGLAFRVTQQQSEEAWALWEREQGDSPMVANAQSDSVSRTASDRGTDNPSEDEVSGAPLLLEADEELRFSAADKELSSLQEATLFYRSMGPTVGVEVLVDEIEGIVLLHLPGGFQRSGTMRIDTNVYTLCPVGNDRFQIQDLGFLDFQEKVAHAQAGKEVRAEIQIGERKYLIGLAELVEVA